MKSKKNGNIPFQCLSDNLLHSHLLYENGKNVLFEVMDITSYTFLIIKAKNVFFFETSHRDIFQHYHTKFILLGMRARFIDENVLIIWSQVWSISCTGQCFPDNQLYLGRSA